MSFFVVCSEFSFIFQKKKRKLTLKNGRKFQFIESYSKAHSKWTFEYFI